MRKHSAVKLIFLLIVSTFFCSEGLSQSITISISYESIGTITDVKTGKPAGTGFVAGSSRLIMTCAHVIGDSSYTYEPVMKPGSSNTRKALPLKLMYVFPSYDLAVLSVAEDVTNSPLRLGDFRRVRPGDKVIYVGWVADKNNFQVDQAIISATGAAVNGDAVIEFLEFQGVGKPGYSGGPVFDANGNVVAVMTEAWTKRGVKGGGETLINRAFSVDVLSILTKQLFTGATK